MTLPDWLSQLLAILGGAGVVILAAVGVAYWVFQTLSKGWLDAHFTERLERLRHAQSVELENLRLEINKTFDRATKVLSKELEVLPRCWSLMDDAHMRTKLACSWMRESVDVTAMSEERLREFLDSTELLESQKREILESEDRSRSYSEYEIQLQLHRAHKSYSKFHNYVVRSGVFVRPELAKKFDDAAQEIGNAIRLRRLMVQPHMNLPKIRDDLDTALSKSEELHVQVRAEVQVLWFGDVTASRGAR